MKIRITTDSAADISQDLCEKYNITVIPLYVIIDGVSYKDRLEVTVDQLFAAMERNGPFPTTSAISEHDFVKLFSSLSDGETEIIHLSISSMISACYRNALKAARNFPNVHVIDSKLISSGITMLAIRAAEMIEEGMDVNAICEELERLIIRTDLSLVLDTLKAVRKGGRVSTLQALGAELFQFKPMIVMKNGEFGVTRKYRGKSEKTHKEYITSWLKDRTDIDLSRIILAHNFRNPAMIEPCKELVQSLQPFQEMLIQEVGCTISCHGGPDAFGMIFFQKPAESI
jgi:DegV family protein with EDD domain